MEINLNKVELIGFAGMDIKVQEFKKGSKVARFSLGTSEGFKNKLGEWVNTTAWHRIVIWNENADKAERAIKKGCPILITGRLCYRFYKLLNGEKRMIVEILADNLEMVA